jgi:hypothetical protein
MMEISNIYIRSIFQDGKTTTAKEYKKKSPDATRALNPDDLCG